MKQTSEQVLSRNGDNREGAGNLTVSRDFLEDVKSRLAQSKKDGETIAELKEHNDWLRTRVDKLIKYTEALDERLNDGSKVFQAPTRQGTVDRYTAGKGFTAARRFFRDHTLDEGFTRASSQNEGAGTTGSVLVPTITEAAVHRIVGEGSIPRKISLMVPMVTNKMILPVNPNGPSVSYADGNYPPEGSGPGAGPSTAVETPVTLTSKTLDTKTLMVLDTVSLELSEDSLVAIEPLLAQIFGEAVALEENRQAFNSSNPFTGVLNTSGIGYYYLGNTYNSGKTAFSQVKHSDLVGTQFAVNSKIIHRGTWICSPSFFQHCVALKDTNDRPIFATQWGGGMLPGFQTDGSMPDMQLVAPAILLGRPCFLTEAMPTVSGSNTVAAIYGDFRYHAFGLRKELAIEWNDSVYFTWGVSAVRLRQRYAMTTLIPGAFAVTKTSVS